MSKPVKVRVRMYQVGFGDCFLVSVEYDKPLPDGRAERHLLIDYGSTRAAREGRAPGKMRDVAPLIEKHTSGVLDVLALTHRHKDHLFGFADDTGDATLRRLDPKLVLRPWTEDPDLQTDATGPGAALVGAASASFAASLAGAQAAAERLSTRAGLHEDVLAAAAEQVKNPEAIKLLDDLAAAGEGRYLFAGADPDVTKTVPGLKVTVLGPPTVDQDPRVSKQREDDEDEYWMLRLRASLDSAAGAAAEGAVATCDVDLGPGPVRWLVDRLADQRDHSAARLVRHLDDALNNTSLVLLLEIGGLKLLFPGDAQIENWQYTLEKLGEEKELREKLRDIDLYKVGHHGSRNATPRSLHALWKERPATLPALTILMSTRPGVHGESEATRVPRQTLVDALEEVGTLYSTDDLVEKETYVEVEADVTGGPFRQVPFVAG
ncbi:MAG: hypothetical protein J7518_15825 [Nocardioidaceae bacterium]|nr:hypothetical protein [Nocardioidaceae bacterium]